MSRQQREADRLLSCEKIRQSLSLNPTPRIVKILEADLRKLHCSTPAVATPTGPSLSPRRLVTTSDIVAPGRSEPPTISTARAPLTEDKPMGFSSVISSVVNAVTGRGTTTSATVDDATTPSLLDSAISVVGTGLDAVLNPGSVGTRVGATLGDTALATTTSTTPGRSIAPLGYGELEAETPAEYTARTGRSVRGPNAGKVRRLVRLIGVANASSILGLTIGATALLAVKPARRRGISAAALRTTRRTIRAVNSIQHSLSKIKHRRR
jgi:hypothetical protein